MSVPYTPKSCPSGCGRPLGSGRHGAGSYHLHDCEPTTCTCDTPFPDLLGECACCHRLVLTHSWHEGRPDAGERGAA